MTRSKLITNPDTVAYGDASTSSNSSDQQSSNASRNMIDEKPTQPLQSDKVSVKLVKTSPAQEATTEHEPGSSSFKSSQLPHQGNHRCDSNRHNCLFNVSHKIFRDFDKTIPAVWFTLFELKLPQCALATDEERSNALLLCLPNDVLLIVHDILVNQPSYQRIKQRLIQWFEPNLSSRVSELLGCTTVPEEKPSQFLLTLRTKLAQSDSRTVHCQNAGTFKILRSYISRKKKLRWL